MYASRPVGSPVGSTRPPLRPAGRRTQSRQPAISRQAPAPLEIARVLDPQVAQAHPDPPVRELLQARFAAVLEVGDVPTALFAEHDPDHHAAGRAVAVSAQLL